MTPEQRILARLCGKWSGRGESSGASMADRLECRSLFDGSFVRFRLSGSDTFAAEGFIRFNEQAKPARFEFYEFSNGPRAVRIAWGQPQGRDELVFDERGAKCRIRFRFVGRNTFCLTEARVVGAVEHAFVSERFARQAQ
jgi:hypothetical protein